jgi:hypothetical protein
LLLIVARGLQSIAGGGLQPTAQAYPGRRRDQDVERRPQMMTLTLVGFSSLG